MDFQNRAGNKAGGGGVAGFSVIIWKNYSILILIIKQITLK